VRNIPYATLTVRSMLRWLDNFRRTFLDIRPGELGRTAYVGLYLLFVLFAYYILKPVSRALFVNKFDLDKLPLLYILIAPAGGVLAYVYSRLAVRVSLTAAVNAATAFAIGFTILMGYLIRTGWTWTYYVFNIWVSMFSIMLVTQGWVIAANVFTSREAKRLYGVLGLGAVIGAGFGGTFTSLAVRAIGENNLILASAGITFVAYLMYRILLRQPGVNLEQARGAEAEEADFSVRDILGDVLRHRHLQVIVGIVLLMFVVDVTVEYQFQAFAKARYQGRDLTAFMGSFNGVYLNLVNFVFQFFLTGAVIRWVGVGGVLQIMPITIAISSIGIYLAPGVLTSSLARLTEAATRYTFNRTGMELLYLPLPLELRNRVKAFLDIFVDRFGRGIGGVLLYLFTVVLDVEAKTLSLVTIVFCVGWGVMSWLAQREYLSTVRRRLETRTLDLESLRVSAADGAMVAMLERTARGENGRQGAYAFSLLASAPGYDAGPLAMELTSSRHPEVRGAAFEAASASGAAPDTLLLQAALAEIRSSRGGSQSPAVAGAVRYALAASPEAEALRLRLLDHPSEQVAEIAVRHAVQANAAVPMDWIERAAESADATHRRLASLALAGHGEASIPLLRQLLADPERVVAEAALETAGRLRKRVLIDDLVRKLGDYRLRAGATDALAAYGSSIAGTLCDLMDEPEVPRSARYRIPRVLERMREQRAADELLNSITTPDLLLRGYVLRALGRMREAAPQLDFGPAVVDKQILEEAKIYFSLWAALDPLRHQPAENTNAARLLVSTLEDRLNHTLERLFHLLGLKYSRNGIQGAYRALKSKSSENHSAAIEFLDSVLDRELKRFLMPLLDDTARLSESGRELFGIERHTPESALRAVMRSGDAWPVACAITAAVELRFQSLRPEIEQLRGRTGPDVDMVAERALAELAPQGA
jgi:AAA family ATP:ADP antiporter